MMTQTGTPRFLARLRREDGTVLITALVAAVLLAGLVASFMTVSATHHVSTQRNLDAAQSFYMAEGANEQMRLALVTDYRTSGLTLGDWLSQVRSGARFGDEESYEEGRNAAWVKEISGASADHGWVDVESLGNAATNTALDGTADGAERRLVQRVAFGNADLFNLAFLTEKTNCMFCHLKVR